MELNTTDDYFSPLLDNTIELTEETTDIAEEILRT